MKRRPREYTCAACGQACVDGWTEEESNAEAAAVFGVEQASTRADMMRVCDDCYRNIMQWMHENPDKVWH